MSTNEEYVRAALNSDAASAAAGGEDGGFWDFDIGPEVPVLGSLLNPAPTEEEQVQSQREDYNTFARSAGLATTGELSESSTIEALLEQAGVDVDHPNVQALLTGYGDMLQDPALGPALIANLVEQYPAVPTQAYDQALAQSGFSGSFVPPAQPGGLHGLAAREGLQVAQFRAAPTYETQPDTGWIRYENGVLVSPDGQVAFDPTSTAPGSIRWQREVVSGWSTEKVSEWRDRLHKLGYLTKEEAKVEGVDNVLLNALSNYHISRYANGGKPVAGDLAGTGASGAGDKPPLVNFEDMSAQVRNDVREQYRRVYGEDPTDGEVAAFSDYIIRTATDLQKRFRRKGYGGYTSMAATEAEERFIEHLEQSPQAVFERESDEENTALRDALQQSVIVANSLAG
jgi:hypothetical protein